MRTFLGLGLALLLAGYSGSESRADAFGDWQKFRASKFAELVAARPDQDATIADIKARTAAMIAASSPPLGPTLDRPPVVWRTSDKPVVVFDAPFAPRMIVVPAGDFTMGSPASEAGHTAREGPRHRVRIAYPLAVGMFEVANGEYAWFVSETGHVSGASCVTLENGRLNARAGRDWRNPGYPQTVTSPASCIDHDDAVAYVAWLSKKTGHTYRLLSEAEYEWADRAGAATAYAWGGDAAAGCAFSNGYDLDAQPYKGAPTPIACHDGYPVAAPLGKLKANAFGLFDMSGNVFSWTSDCWNPTYAGAPTDGAPNLRGDCSANVLRGASWLSVDLRAAARGHDRVGYVGVHHGLRVARVL